jgi:hypothetical protein
VLKVGHSGVGAHYRATSQGWLTALPEDPILLRIYPVAESAKAERDFHAWLRDADHAGERTQRIATSLCARHNPTGYVKKCILVWPG